MASFDKILRYGTRREYKKDEIICIQGDTGKVMYIVLKGTFGVYINSLTDFPLKIAEIVSGHFFGEMAMLDGEPRSATVIALEDSIVLSIAKEAFRDLVLNDGETALAIMQVLSKRIRGLIKRLEQGSNTKDTEYFKSMLSKDEVKASDGKEKIIVLPEGQKAYRKLKTVNDEHYLYERWEICPVCEKGFEIKVPIYSKLAQKTFHVERDTRTVYENFDPLWYSIWVCPHCNYANYFSSFSNITCEAITSLKKSNFSERVVRVYGGSSITIDSVIENCYLFMLCNKMGEKDPRKDAKTWIRLYWFYGDANDNKMKTSSAEKALKGYAQIVTSMEIDDRIQVYTIMAELSVFLNRKDDALEFYRYVCTEAKKRNTMMYRQAVLRIQELKQKGE